MATSPASCHLPPAPYPARKIQREKLQARDKLFNGTPRFLSLFPELPMSGQFLCVLPVNNFVYYFVSFIFIFCNFMRQLLPEKGDFVVGVSQQLLAKKGLKKQLH